ncbi:UNVERIFIED_CONTAM: hypothetical protein GTU68_034584 [Idotea baltica]|nr:hypothetical protein [Idotea baltica]
MFAKLRRTFQYLDKKTFVPLYKSIVRKHLDFASSAWYPYKVKHIEQIEAVQRRATRQIPSFKNMSYPERLKELKLPTLSYRCIRGDMIELFKIIKEGYNPQASNFIQLWQDAASRTDNRGHDLKVFPKQARPCLRRNTFGIRNVQTWNSLPSNVVNE